MSEPATPKPQTYNGDLARLPLALAHLREQQVWVCWCWFWNGKKWTKPPYRADKPRSERFKQRPGYLGHI